MVSKCLQADANDRYQDAAALAADLRRHLADLPLRSVRNRSFSERWRKWRRRSPQSLPRLAVVAVAATAILVASMQFFDRQVQGARLLLTDADELIAQQAWGAAGERLQAGLGGLRLAPGHADLKRSLAERFAVVKRGRLASDLHQLVERLRYLDGTDWPPIIGWQEIDDGCRAIWNAREDILHQFSSAPSANDEWAAQVRTDLLDLAILWSGQRVGRANDVAADALRREALQRLEEAESLLGSTIVLDHERAACERDLEAHEPTRAGVQGRGVERRTSEPALSVWEHDALGRRLLRDGELAAAANELEKALEITPDAFWPNFHLGACRFRQGRHAEALRVFSVCVALAPKSAECYYNRGLAFAALGEVRRALGDYGRALRRGPGLTLPEFRGTGYYSQREQFDRAADALTREADSGADPADIQYEWALLHLARRDHAAALECLAMALARAPQHPDALWLLQRLQDGNLPDAALQSLH
jgi:tetratricopeptide (TPR) repeat protein